MIAPSPSPSSLDRHLSLQPAPSPGTTLCVQECRPAGASPSVLEYRLQSAQINRVYINTLIHRYTDNNTIPMNEFYNRSTSGSNWVFSLKRFPGVLAAFPKYVFILPGSSTVLRGTPRLVASAPRSSQTCRPRSKVLPDISPALPGAPVYFWKPLQWSNQFRNS